MVWALITPCCERPADSSASARCFCAGVISRSAQALAILDRSWDEVPVHALLAREWHLVPRARWSASANRDTPLRGVRP